jgi:signal transduction histidine kinase
MRQENGQVIRPWRLRTRLALALLAVFIPLSILVFVTHIENLNDQRESRVESFETIGDTIAAVVDGFTRDLESFALSTTITLSEVADADFNQANAGPYFQHLAESYGILRAIFLTDPQGRVIASNTGEMNGFDLSSRTYIKALQAGADATWSEGVAGAVTGQTTLAHARTVRNQAGETRYFLVIAFYPSQLATRLPADLPADSSLSLIDGNGVVLYSSEEGLQGAPAVDISGSAVFQAARSGETGLIRSESTPLQEEDRYGAFVPVERMGWVVGFSRPASVVDGPLNDRFIRDLAIVFWIMVAGFGAMYLIALRLSRPLSSLSTAAEAIARGERPDVSLKGADADVRRLADAMETMTLAVNDREARLRSQTRLLETLESVGAALAKELDFQKAVGAITNAGIELTGAESIGVLHKLSPPSEELTLIGSAGAAFPLTADDPIVQQVVTGKPVSIRDLAIQSGPQPERMLQPGNRPVRSITGVPVVSRRGDVFGGLFFLQSQDRAFTDEHNSLAFGLARRAGAAIENARLYSEAKEVQEELRKANQAKTEFIGVMSHELRTPITTIYGGARLLHNRRTNLSDEAAEEMIASIEEEAERLYRLVENLLALARSDMGEEIVPDVLPIAPIVEQAVKQFNNRHPGRPIEIKPAKSLPLTLAESAYVHQILHNLITNADKYSPAGLPIEIEIDPGAEGNEVMVRVLDRGPGVAQDEIEQIFESFYRSQRTARQASGKGLGLTVCKRLIDAMSGRIWASLRPGGGLEVGFALPVAAEAEQKRDPAPVEAPR